MSLGLYQLSNLALPHRRATTPHLISGQRLLKHSNATVHSRMRNTALASPSSRRLVASRPTSVLPAPGTPVTKTMAFDARGPSLVDHFLDRPRGHAEVLWRLHRCGCTACHVNAEVQCVERPRCFVVPWGGRGRNAPSSRVNRAAEASCLAFCIGLGQSQPHRNALGSKLRRCPGCSRHGHPLQLGWRQVSERWHVVAWPRG